MAYVDTTTKKYVDYAGLKYYDELIKKFIKEGNTDAIDKLIALIGAAEKGADEKTILARIADLETAVGDVSELGEDVANLTKAILGESTRAKGVEGTLANLTTDVKDNLVSAINEVDAHADAAQADVDALEELVGTVPAKVGETETKTVISYVDAKVAEVNSAVEDLNLAGDDATSEAKAGITVKVEQSEGQISKPVVSVTPVTVTAGGEQGARTLAASDETSVMIGSAVAQIKKYSDETLADAIAALDVTTNDSDKVAGIQIGVTEVDGKVQKPSLTVDNNKVEYVAKTETEAAKVTVADTAAVLKGDAVAEIIKYVDAMDAAGASDADARLEALEATHATKDDGSMKTVSEEVNEAVTALVDGAPEALDTLKEIADWIANQDESGVTDVASLVSRVDTLSGADTVVGSVAKAEKDAKAYTDAEIAKLDSTATDADKGVSVSAAIEDGKLTETGIDVAITAATVTYTAHTDAAEGQDAVAPNLAVTANAGNVLTSEAIGAVKSYVDDAVALANKGADEAIKALDKTVNQNGISDAAAGTDFKASGLQLYVDQEDGLLKSVNGSINTVTEADIDALFAKSTT